jgi:hypothetical protein
MELCQARDVRSRAFLLSPAGLIPDGGRDIIEQMSKSANQQIGESANWQISKSANQQLGSGASEQIGKRANRQS